jgi:hypothetical protein
MIHESTRYAWMPVNPFIPRGPSEFRKVARGSTFRRAQ